MLERSKKVKSEWPRIDYTRHVKVYTNECSRIWRSRAAAAHWRTTDEYDTRPVLPRFAKYSKNRDCFEGARYE